MSGNDQLAAYRNSKHTFVILVLLVFLVNTQSDQYDFFFLFPFPFCRLFRNPLWATGAPCPLQKELWKWWQTKDGTCPVTWQKLKSTRRPLWPALRWQGTVMKRTGGQAWTAGSAWSLTQLRAAKRGLPSGRTIVDVGAWEGRRAPQATRPHTPYRRKAAKWARPVTRSIEVSSILLPWIWTNRAVGHWRRPSMGATTAARFRAMWTSATIKWNFQRSSKIHLWPKGFTAIELDYSRASAQERVSARGVIKMGLAQLWLPNNPKPRVPKMDYWVGSAIQWMHTKFQFSQKTHKRTRSVWMI